MSSSLSLLSLPNEIFSTIAQSLPLEDLSRLSRASQALYTRLGPHVWIILNLKVPPYWKGPCPEESFLYLEDFVKAQQVLAILRSPRPVLQWVRKLHLILEGTGAGEYLPYSDGSLRRMLHLGSLNKFQYPRNCMVPHHCIALRDLLPRLIHLESLSIDIYFDQLSNPVRQRVYKGYEWKNAFWSFHESLEILNFIICGQSKAHLLQLIIQYNSKILPKDVLLTRLGRSYIEKTRDLCGFLYEEYRAKRENLSLPKIEEISMEGFWVMEGNERVKDWIASHLEPVTDGTS